ncbi:MAG: FAD:protein FMN transferase [Gaiellaceae bacterium]
MILASLEQQEFRAMGTLCRIAVTARAQDRGDARRALEAARTEVAACEHVLSRFDRGSDLSLLNAAAGDWAEVDERLTSALRLALWGREESGGRFDPTILPALAAAGYDRSFEQLEERAPASAGGWRPGAAIELDMAAGRARIEARSAVDLGGIGKGFSADRALGAMREAWPGLPGGLVDLGGDIAFWGTPPERGPWRLAIADPRRPQETLGILELHEGGVATSGRDERRFGPGRELHHLIDPSTGLPAARGPLAVTVVGRSAAECEVHSTALAICGLEEALAYVAARAHLSALLVPDEGDPVEIGDLPLARRAPE